VEALGEPNVLTKKVSLLEAQCTSMKPNLGAIAEYKKKVGRFSFFFVITKFNKISLFLIHFCTASNE